MILRQIRRSWLRRALRFLRWSRFSAYVTIGLAGVASIAIPPASIRAATGGAQILLYSWSVLMAISALFCAWGAAADRWVGEYVGLIPLSTVAVAYGVSALTRGSVGWSGGLFLIGFFWLLVTRWQEVALLRAEAVRLTVAERRAGVERHAGVDRQEERDHADDEDDARREAGYGAGRSDVEGL